MHIIVIQSSVALSSHLLLYVIRQICPNFFGGRIKELKLSIIFFRTKKEHRCKKKMWRHNGSLHLQILCANRIYQLAHFCAPPPCVCIYQSPLYLKIIWQPEDSVKVQLYAAVQMKGKISFCVDFNVRLHHFCTQKYAGGRKFVLVDMTFLGAQQRWILKGVAWSKKFGLKILTCLVVYRILIKAVSEYKNRGE